MWEKGGKKRKKKRKKKVGGGKGRGIYLLFVKIIFFVGIVV